MQLLEGSKTEKRLQMREEAGDTKEERNLTDEEIEKQISKLKKKKVAGEDEILNETWIYSKKMVRQKRQLEKCEKERVSRRNGDQE